METSPLVSIVVAARNEFADIADCIKAILAQDYPHDRLELIVVDGGSTDGTGQVARSALANHDLSAAEVFLNPTGTTPSNLNAAALRTHGDVICRVDARSIIPSDYVRRCVEVLGVHPDVVVVGGAQIATPRRDHALDVGIARALNNRWWMGLARYRRRSSSGPSDTVYLGTFRASVLKSLGGWDDRLLTNQDFDLNRRMSEHGVVWFDSNLAVQYRPRRRLRDLFSQYLRFGTAKVRYWSLTGERPLPRQVVLMVGPPVAALAALATLLALPKRHRRCALLSGIGFVALTEAKGTDQPRAGPTGHAVAVVSLIVVAGGWLTGVYWGLLDTRRQNSARSAKPAPKRAV